MAGHSEIPSIGSISSVGDAGAAKPHFSGFSTLHSQAVDLLTSRHASSDYRIASAATLPASAPADVASRTTDRVAPPAAPAATWDSTKPATQLAKAGVFIDRTAEAGARVADIVNPTTDTTTTTPKISVEFENKLNPQPTDQLPHFVVKKDGTIEMFGDPEALGSKNIRVQVERDAGDTEPTAQQNIATQDLVSYLSDRLKTTNPADVSNLTIDDKDNLVDQNTEARNNLKPPSSRSGMTPETQEAVENNNRMARSNGVNMPGAASERMGSFDTRQVPRQIDETEKEAALKEAVAGLFRPDQGKPYETVRRAPNGDGYRVGRYGFSGGQLLSWLDALGDPPDPALIEKLIKEGKLPKSFANPEKLKQLRAMATRMKAGEQPTSDEMKDLLPKEAQETIAGSLLAGMGSNPNVGDNAGKIAAGMMSGKAPGDVTADDVNSEMGQQLAKAGQNIYDLATKRPERGDGAVLLQGERRNLIQQALKIAGEDPNNESYITAVNQIVQHESSWNPRAFNDWDSNARKGIPSQGLMQTIPPTFNSYKDKTGQVEAAGQSNSIMNPLANLVAGINYSRGRYGGLDNVPGVKAVRSGQAYRPY